MPLSNLQTEIPGRITREELVTTAAEHDWGEPTIHNIDSDGYWSIEYTTAIDAPTANHIEIVIDPESEINGEPLNNVFVRGDTAVPINTYDDFDPIRRLVENNEHVLVTPRLSEGHWERLTASDRDVSDENNIPHEDVFNTITGKGVKFGVQLSYVNSTQEITIEGLIEAVNTITEAYQDLG